MVHQYKLNGYNIVLDSASGSVHAVDEVAYDIISLYRQKSEEEIKQIVDLMMKVKSMGIDYKVLAEQADDIYAKYKDDIKAGTFDINKVDINDLNLTKIVENAITNTVKNIGKSISGFISGLFK